MRHLHWLLRVFEPSYLELFIWSSHHQESGFKSLCTIRLRWMWRTSFCWAHRYEAIQQQAQSKWLWLQAIHYPQIHPNPLGKRKRMNWSSGPSCWWIMLSQTYVAWNIALFNISQSVSALNAQHQRSKDIRCVRKGAIRELQPGPKGQSPQKQRSCDDLEVMVFKTNHPSLHEKALRSPYAPPMLLRDCRSSEMLPSGAGPMSSISISKTSETSGDAGPRSKQ